MNELNNGLAFVFPGQGSQSLGMLDELASHFPLVKELFDTASAQLNKDLWRMVCEGPEAELNQTENTQPLMLVAGVAVWRVWCESSQVRPGWMAGHSLGEYSALVCSEAITFEDAVKLVAVRARLMQQAVPPGVGAMAAILGLEDHHVVNLCRDVAGNDIVAPVNFNSPGQVVIAGHLAAVERAMEAAKEKGAKRVVLLPISVPSHCQLMEEAAETFDQSLQQVTIETPKIPIIHNVDVTSHAAPEVIRSVLKQQLYNPVRWVDTIKFMHEQGVNEFIECGPGKVLSALCKRTARGCIAQPLYDTATLTKVKGLIE